MKSHLASKAHLFRHSVCVSKRTLYIYLSSIKKNLKKQRLWIIYLSIYIHHRYMMAVVVLSSKEEIEQFIQEHEKCIIKFSAEWCAPCRRMAQYFEVWKKYYSDVKNQRLANSNYSVAIIELFYFFGLWRKLSNFWYIKEITLRVQILMI